MIKKGSWVKYVTEDPHLEAVGVVTDIEYHSEMGYSRITFDVFCQTNNDLPYGWEIGDSCQCALSNLTEITLAEATLFILKNGGKNA